MPTPTLPLERSRASDRPQPAADAVIFEDVRLAFDQKVVLDGVSFRLAGGETKAIFGVAGAGKSTILKLTLGLLQPDSGRILVLGQDVTAMREQELFALRRKIGMVFQESALFDSLTVRDNVAFRLLEEGDVPRRKALDRRERTRGVELLWRLPSTHRGPCSPSEFSVECADAWPLPAPSLPSPSCCSMTPRPAGWTR